jgi:ABC-type antimicrobial peptide transport system permease subunit
MLRASLRYFRATNAMVILGVAVAVAVLAGALLVGASVRESLRQIALGRLGATEVVITAPIPFRAALADDLSGSRLPAPGSPLPAPGSRLQAAPLIVFGGAVSHDESKRSSGSVMVYGIDERFGRFHGVDNLTPNNRDAFLSPALASELGANAGDGITLRVARPTDIPLSTLQGRKEVTGQRIRLNVARILDRASLGEFSLSPSQGSVLALYVPIARLQRDLDLGERANALLVRGGGDHFDLPAQLTPALTLDDLSLRTRVGPGGITVVESRAGIISDPLAEQISEIGRNDLSQVLTYVTNSIRIGDREVPYSTVSAVEGLDLGNFENDRRPLFLNEWAAEDLKATVGDIVTLEYFLWSDEDGLETASAEFTFAGVVPMDGLGGDQTLTPEYPGISDAADMTSWDPPFPVDLKRVRPKDEEYWDRYRAAPKAFISIADGQRLWGSRYGKVSSFRIPGAIQLNAQAIDPAAAGFSARHVRQDAAAAAQGTTDFGEYFLYFSFFLVVSALLLAYLFFAVGLEQRTTEIGLLSAVGFSPGAIRRSFLKEGAVLAGIGAVIGAVAAVGYGAAIMYGLRTWWVGAVGTTELRLHVAPEWLAIGVAGALGAGILAIWLGVRAMTRRSARSLLKGDTDSPTRHAAATTKLIAGLLLVVGAVLLAAAQLGAINATAGFFGAGGAWLVGGLCAASILLRRRRSSTTLGRGVPAMFRLGLRHTSVRPARSVLSLALIAFACFVLVSVGAFRKDVTAASDDRASGTGGFALMAESVAPLMHDPNTREGRDGLALDPDDPIVAATRISRFRLRPGDETSCLTLYKPTNPRIIAPEPRFLDEPRFSFAASMATTPEEIANPWRLLNKTFEDGAVPAIADQTTLMYVLHLGVGDDFVFTPEGHPEVRLRIVGALADSVLQSELIIGEPAFIRLFPRHEGYRVWMIDTSSERRGGTSVPPGEVTTHLEDRLSDFGLDVVDTHERWASYHQVENTYLATFQALGSLGLLLGTVGLGAVLARNVLERRREIGLLTAVGYAPSNVRSMVLSEGLALVLGGLLIGTGCAVIAILPALRERAQSLPIGSVLTLLAGVVVTGAIASLVAIKLTTRTPVVTALKAE